MTKDGRTVQGRVAFPVNYVYFQISPAQQSHDALVMTLLGGCVQRGEAQVIWFIDPGRPHSEKYLHAVCMAFAGGAEQRCTAIISLEIELYTGSSHQQFDALGMPLKGSAGKRGVTEGVFIIELAGAKREQGSKTLVVALFDRNLQRSSVVMIR